MHSYGLRKYTRPIYILYINKTLTNVSILLAWLSAAGKEVVLYLVARNTLYIKIFFKITFVDFIVAMIFFKTQSIYFNVALHFSKPYNLTFVKITSGDFIVAMIFFKSMSVDFIIAMVFSNLCLLILSQHYIFQNYIR